jgi:hypothetical protein
MDENEKAKTRAETAGKLQIGTAIFVLILVLFEFLPHLTYCMNGYDWACWTIQNWDWFFLLVAGVISLIFTTFGILNLRRAKR